MQFVLVRTITLSCMVVFENNFVQLIIMTKQCVMKKNHDVRSQVYLTVCNKTLCIYFSETCSCLPITWSSMLGFINNVAQIIFMTRRCIANKSHVANLKFKVIDHT